MRILRLAAALVAVSGLVLGCGSADPQKPNRPPSLAQAKQVEVTKLLVFIVENHSLDQMRDGMPFTFGLAEKYGYATDFAAIRHPSLPNYLAITGGSTFDVINDNPPAINGVSGESVFGQAVALGKTARLYADAMPQNCTAGNAGRYAVRHNPWAYYLDEATLCQQYDVPLDAFAGDIASGNLPNAGMVIPDVCHDAHDCPLAAADHWLREQVTQVLAGPDFASGHLMVVLTADESEGGDDNIVLTTVIHPALQGVVADSPLSHYSLTRLYDEVLGAEPLREAAQAPSMLTAFGLRQP